MSMVVNPFAAQVITPVTWNPSDQTTTHTGAVFSNGNLTYASTTSSQACRATTSQSTGKWYLECVVDVASGATQTPHWGLITSAAFPPYPLTNGTGYTIGGALEHGGTPIAFYATLTNGDVSNIAWDADSGKIWFGKNGTWVTGNPATNTSPTDTGLTGARFPVAYCNGVSQLTGRFKLADFTYTPPSGFGAWQS